MKGEEKGEKGVAGLTPSSDGQEQVVHKTERVTADEVAAEIKTVDMNAGVSAKAKAEIARSLSETDATRKELLPLVNERVSRMDAFERRNAGSTIAAELSGMIAASRKAQQERHQQAEHLRQLMEMGQKQIDEHRRKVLEEMARIQAENEYARLHADEI